MWKSREQLPDIIDDKQKQRRSASLLASFKSNLVSGLEKPLLSAHLPHHTNTCSSANSELALLYKSKLSDLDRHKLTKIDRDLDIENNGREETVRRSVVEEEEEASDYIEDNRTHNNNKRTNLNHKVKFGPKPATTCAIILKREKEKRSSPLLTSSIENRDISVRQPTLPQTAAPTTTTRLTHHHGHDHIVVVTLGNIIIWTTSPLIRTIFLSSLVLLISLIMISLFVQEQNTLLPHLSSKQPQQQQQQQQQYSPEIYCTLIEKYHDELKRQNHQQLLCLRNNDHSSLEFNSAHSTSNVFILVPKYGCRSQQVYHLDMSSDIRFNRAIKLEGEGEFNVSSIVELVAAKRSQRLDFTSSNSSWPLSNHEHHLIPLPDFPEKLLKENVRGAEEVKEWKQSQRFKQGQQRWRHYYHYHKLENYHQHYLFHASCLCRHHRNQLSSFRWNRKSRNDDIYISMPGTPPKEVARNILPLPDGNSVLASVPCQCKLRDNDLKLSNGRSLSLKIPALNSWPCQMNHSNGDDALGEVFKNSQLSFYEITASMEMSNEVVQTTKIPKEKRKDTKMTALHIDNDKNHGGHFASFFLFAKAEEMVNLVALANPTSNKAIGVLQKQRVSLLAGLKPTEPEVVAAPIAAPVNSNNIKSKRKRLIVRRHRRRRHGNNLSIIKQTMPKKSRYLILFGLSEHHASSLGEVRGHSLRMSGESVKRDAGPQLLNVQNKLLMEPFAFYRQQQQADINLIADDQNEQSRPNADQNSSESILDGSSNSFEKKVSDLKEASDEDDDDDDGDKFDDDNNRQVSNNVEESTIVSLLNNTSETNIDDDDNNNVTATAIILKDSINITTNGGSKSNSTTNSSDENSQCEEPDQVKDLISSLFLTIAFAFFYFIIFIIGFLGNTLTLLAMRRKREKISTMDIFISNLACSDIMLCIVAVVMTPIYLLYHKYWNFGSFMCKAVAFAQGASVYISTLTLISIAYVRYQLIVHPLGIPMKFCTAILLNCLIWIISFSINVPYLMHMNLLPEKCTIKFCVESWDGDNDRFRFSLITITVQFFLPFFLVSFFYSSISRKLREQKELRDNQHQSERQKYQHQHRHHQNHHQISSNNQNNKPEQGQEQEKISLGRRKVSELANNKVTKKRRSSSSDMMKIKTIHSENGEAKELVNNEKVIYQQQQENIQQQQMRMSNCDVTKSGSSGTNNNNEIANIEDDNSSTKGKKENKRRFGLFSRQKPAHPKCSLKQNATTTTAEGKQVVHKREEVSDGALKSHQDCDVSLQKNSIVHHDETRDSNKALVGRIELEEQVGAEVKKALQDDAGEESLSKVLAQGVNSSVILPQISIVTDGEINCVQVNVSDKSANLGNSLDQTAPQAQQPQLDEDKQDEGKQVEAGIASNSLSTSQRAATVIKIRPSESLIELGTSVKNGLDMNLAGENILPCGDSPTTNTGTLVLRHHTNNGFTDPSTSCTCSCLSNSPPNDTTNLKLSCSYNNQSTGGDKDDNYQQVADREDSGKKSRHSIRHNLLQTLQQTFHLKQKKSSSKENDNTKSCRSSTFTLEKSKSKQHQEPVVSRSNNKRISGKRRRRSAEQVAHLEQTSRMAHHLNLRQEQSCIIANSTVKSTDYFGQPTSIVPSSSKQEQEQRENLKPKQVGTNRYLMNATNADILALKEQRQRERDERLRQTNRKLLWMVIMFVVAWLPLNLFNLIQDYSETVSNSPYTNHVFLIVHLFASSSVCYNPILYAWMSDNYRQELRDILPVFILKRFTCLLGEA